MAEHATGRREHDPTRRSRRGAADPVSEVERAQLRARLDAELEAALADTRAALPPYLVMQGTLADARVVEIPGARKAGGFSPLERMPGLDAKLDAAPIPDVDVDVDAPADAAMPAEAPAAASPVAGGSGPAGLVADTPAADHEPVALATGDAASTDVADSDAPAADTVPADAVPTDATAATAEPGDVNNPDLGLAPETAAALGDDGEPVLNDALAVAVEDAALDDLPAEEVAGEVDPLAAADGVAAEGEVEPAEAASMADFHAAVSARAAAVPRPAIARRGGGVASAAATRAEDIHFTESTVPTAAAGLMPPVPAGMTLPPVATEDNPVPQAIARVEQTSGHTLPEQGFVVLYQTPLGNTPRLGARPVSADQLRAAHHVLEEGPQMSMPDDPCKPLIDLRERMLHPEPVAPTASGETTLVPHPPVPVPTPTPQARTQMAHVFARLLARPQGEARDMVGRARTAAFPGGALARELPGYGDDPHVANLTEELNTQYRDIASQAGVAAGDLDQAIAQRRTVLDEEERAAREALMSSTTDASTLVCTAHDDLSSTIASEAERINTTADAVSASSTGESHTDHIHAMRDRLLAQVTRRTAEIDAAYRRAKEDRDRELDNVQTQRIDAYRAAAQVDDFQLHEMAALPAERQTRLRELYTTSTHTAPSQETGLAQVEINTLVAASNAWADERAVMVRTAVRGFKQTVTERTQGWRTATSDAAEASRKEIRRWDETESGETRSWWDELWNMVNDWVTQAHANTEAWQSQLNAQHATEVVTDLNLIDRLSRAADRGITKEQETELNSLTGDQRQIVQAFFQARSEGRSVDPITLVADLTRTRIWNERRANLISRIEDSFLADDTTPYATIGQVVGRDVNSLASNLYAAFHGNWGILSEAGTDEDAVHAALDGLNRVQSLALRNIYRRRYGVSLESELRDELSGGELDRAEALLSGDRAEAAAAALYSAMHETFLGTGAGTDEATIHSTLRGLNAEERAEVTRIYRERYGRDLATDTRSELNDWATIGTWEADRADAELAGNLQLADAIEIDQELSGSWFHSSTTTTVASVYERVRREVQAQATRENRDSAWMEAEISRRTAGIEREYNGRYAETSGTLDEAIDAGTRSERMFWGSTPENERASADYLHALSRNDMATADAARIRIERTSLTYADDDVINATVGSQYDRALVAERLDYAPERRRALMAELDARERASGHVMTAAERWAEQQEIERTIEREMIVRARGVASTNLDRMESAYSDRYGESARTAILDSTSGVSNEQARTLLDQGGYLDPYQTFDYATRGVGTNEGAATRAFAGLTREEIAKLDARWQREHDGETLREAAASEMSGREWLDVDIALDGAAETIDDQIAQMRRRVEFERPTNGVGALLATEERAVMEAQLAHLEAMAARMHAPPPGSDAEAQRRARDGMLADFDTQNALMQETIEHHRQRSDAMVDSITTVVGIVVAVVVGAVGSIFTGGAAGAVALAIIASLCSTAATMGTKALLKGNAYGWEDIAVDIGVGLVDAVVAALTAGMGDRLLGLARPAGAGAVRSATATGLRGAWQRGVGALNRGAAHLGEQGLVTRGLRPNGVLQRMVSEEASLLSRGAAHAMAQTAENFVQSLPSTVMAVALDDNTWSGPGNPLVNLISGTAQGLGPGLVMGLGFSGASAGFGHLRGALAMPRLGVDTHLRLPERVAPGTPEYHARMTEWQVTHPGRPEAEFQAHIDREFHGAMREAEYQQAVRREVATQLEDVLPPGDRALAAELPVTVVSDLEFRRINNWRGGDATVAVRDGQVHVVVREGASPHAVRAQLESHMSTLRDVEPGTGGRVRDPHAALPRDLRGRLPIEIDPDLSPRSVRVVHDPVPRIVAGPGARAADIHAHVETARNVLQLHGAYGRVRHLLDRFADWAFLHGEAPTGTRAWEAQQELRKLPDIIQWRMREATHPDLTAHQRAQLDLEVKDLQRQDLKYQREFREFDLSPGRGFIAAEGIDRAAKDSYPRRIVTDSPLRKRATPQGGSVRQVGEAWTEGGRSYRHVEAVGAHGRIIDSFSEILHHEGHWGMRGSDSNDQGNVGEAASALEIADRMGGPALIERINQATAEGGTVVSHTTEHFVLDAQNASGQGFDKVRVEIEPGQLIIENGVPHLRDPDYVPLLVIGEDKFMAQVSLESITAIRGNLVDNLVHSLFNRVVDVRQGVIAGDLSALGLTGPHAHFQAELLLRALMHRNFHFEVSIANPRSMADWMRMLPDGTPVPRTQADLERLVLHQLREDIRAQLGGLDVDVTRVVIDERHIEAARADESAQRRIGATPRADELLGTRPGFTPNDAQLRAAWLLSMADSAGGLPAGMVPASTPGEFIDAQGRPVRVLGYGAEIAQVRTIMGVGTDVMEQLRTTVRDPVTGTVHRPVVVIDTTHFTPAHVEALTAYLQRFAVHSFGPGVLENIVFVNTRTGRSGNFASAPRADAVWHTTSSVGAAAGVLQGIDPRFLNPNSRFGAAFYVAEQPGTTLAELAHHGATASTGIRFSIDRNAAQMLDFTNPAVADAWDYHGGPITPETQALAETAMRQGYNAIRFPSERALGGVNIAVLDNHNQILRPEMVAPATP